jgi:hypothetical protein
MNIVLNMHFLAIFQDQDWSFTSLFRVNIEH